MLVNAFLVAFDRDRVATKLRKIVEAKAEDPNMSDHEIAGMWRVVERAERRASGR